MTNLVKLIATVWRGEPARLRDLQAQGRTIDLAALHATDRVIFIGLGFGGEFWRVGPDYQINPGEFRVDGGLLVTQDDRRVTERHQVETITESIETIRFKS